MSPWGFALLSNFAEILALGMPGVFHRCGRKGRSRVVTEHYCTTVARRMVHFCWRKWKLPRFRISFLVRIFAFSRIQILTKKGGVTALWRLLCSSLSDLECGIQVSVCEATSPIQGSAELARNSEFFIHSTHALLRQVTGNRMTPYVWRLLNVFLRVILPGEGRWLVSHDSWLSFFFTNANLASFVHFR